MRAHAADAIDAEPAWDVGSPDEPVFTLRDSAPHALREDRTVMQALMERYPHFVPDLAYGTPSDDFDEAALSGPVKTAGIVHKSLTAVTNGVAFFGQAYGRNNPRLRALLDRPKNTP